VKKRGRKKIVGEHSTIGSTVMKEVKKDEKGRETKMIKISAIHEQKSIHDNEWVRNCK